MRLLQKGSSCRPKHARGDCLSSKGRAAAPATPALRPALPPAVPSIQQEAEFKPDYGAVRQAIADLLESNPDYDDGSYGPLLVRCGGGRRALRVMPRCRAGADFLWCIWAAGAAFERIIQTDPSLGSMGGWPVGVCLRVSIPAVCACM